METRCAIPTLNESLQVSAYAAKRERYAQESMFATPRFVAREWDTWTPDTIRERAERLAEWALGRWPYGPSASRAR